MPWGDGTGPWGLGPMTGRAAGYCAGYPIPGYMNPIPRFGWGRGRGFRRMFWGYGWLPWLPMLGAYPWSIYRPPVYYGYPYSAYTPWYPLAPYPYW